MPWFAYSPTNRLHARRADGFPAIASLSSLFMLQQAGGRVFRYIVAAIALILCQAVVLAPVAQAQSVANGLGIYTTGVDPAGGGATGLGASGCRTAGCHATGPAVASVGHQAASNNPAQIAAAIANNALTGMGFISLTATQRMSLALYIGQIKTPAFTSATALDLRVRAGIASNAVDVYSLLRSDGSGGAAQDTSGITGPGAAKGNVTGTAVGAGATMNYNVVYTPNAGALDADSFNLTITNPTGSASRTVNVTIYGINSAASVTGIAGQTYTAGTPLYQITSNDPAATTFTQTNLPTGLSLSGANIIGTANTPGTFNTVTVGATINSAGNAALPGSPSNNGAVTRALTITMVGITSNNATGNQNQLYTAGAPLYQITTNGTPQGANPYSATGLPTGLNLDTATGAITGTPTLSGTTNVTLSVNVATTAGTMAASKTVSFTIVSAGAPAITSPTAVPPPAITVGQPFSVQIVATNPPITSYSATGLPPGLMVDTTTGVISGTPTQSGVFTATLSASNAAPGAGVMVAFTVNPASVPALTSPTSITGTQNQLLTPVSIVATNPPITAYGGTGLPTGLTVNPTTGQITGTPTVAGSFSATLTATNVVGTGSLAVPITIIASAVPGITSPTSANGTVGQAFNVSIAATNPPVTAYGGTGLPPGLSVNVATGNVSGTPTQAGTFNATLTATNNAGTGSLAVTFTIAVAPIPPVAGATAITVQLNTPATVDLAPFITGTGVTGIAIGTAPAHGTATVSGTRVIYTPVNNYFGPDSFTYAAINQFGTSPAATVSVTVVGRPDPTRDAAVVGLIAAQADAALRFSRAQISNFQRRMESLHRRSATGASAASGGIDRSAVAAPSPATTAAATMKQLAGDVAAHSGPDPLRVTATSAAPQLPDSQGGDSAFSKLFPLAASAMSMMASRTVNLGSLTARGAPAAAAGAQQDTGVNFWIDGNASFGTRDATGDRSGLDFSTSGISFGADRRFGEQWALGIGGGYARDKTDVGVDGTHSRAQGYAAAVYGSFQPGRNFFVDGLLGAGTLNFDTQRFVAPANSFSSADRDGYQVFASLAAGYEHQEKGLLVSPYARLDYSRDRLDQVTETGAGQFALTYFKQTATSVQGALGLRAESAHAANFGWIAPRARIELRHEFEGERLAQLAYADLIAQRYAVSTGAISRNALAVGIGSDFVLRDGLTIGVDYQYLHSFGENASHAFRVRLAKELDGPGPGAALRAAATPATMPLDIRVDAGYMFDDNVTRSRTPGDILSDQSYSVGAGKVIVIPLTDHARALVGGSAGAEKFRNYDGLSRVFAGATGELQYRTSGEFTAPTFALFGRVTAEDYESGLRDGYRTALGISWRQPLTDRLELFSALTHNERYADSAVFTTRDNAVRLNLDWSVGPRSLLYVGAEYRRGDIVSTGRPTLEDVDIAKVLVADDAYPGRNFFSYKFEGHTVLTTLGYNLGLGPRDSLDFSWRRAESTPSLRPSFATSDSSYIANQYFIVYLTRF